MVSDIDRAIDALHFIPADLPRDDWHRVGRAAIAAGLDVDALIDWSRNAPNFKSEQDVRAAFKTVTAEGGTGAGTLFKIAAENGWRMGGERPTPRPAQAAKRPAEPRPKPAPSASAVAVLERCKPATAAHPYAVKKGASPEALAGVMVLPATDPLVIGGAPMGGALVVPAYAPDGTLQSAQLIPPQGKKMNLPGAPMAGASFTVGQIKPGEPTYVVEGVASGWSVWQATGTAAVVAFGWGNVSRVAAALRQQDATAKLVICPDVGKEADAQKIASEHDCLVAPMPGGWPANSDVNDLFLRDGFDVLAALLESASAPPKPEPLLKPVSVFDVVSNPSPPPAFAWDGYLPRGVVSLLGAHGGTGKSTIALMLAVNTALGKPLFGVDTEQSNVLFVSAEDAGAIVRHRLSFICKAWAINPGDLEGRLTIVDATVHPELFTADNRSAGDTTASYSELCALVQATGAGLVVVDNASDTYGGNEIDRRQVRAFVRALAQVARLTDCAVLLLAHVDKGTSRNRSALAGEGYSGSTAWHNSVRSRLFMSRAESGLLTLEHQKSNLGKMCEPITLWWPENGLPQLAEPGNERQQGRADDTAAAELLKLLAEFESRGQFASPAPQARNNVFALLRSEPTFKALKLHQDDVRRIVTQCQRAGWLEPLDYRSLDRKERQRWLITPEGKSFAGLTAPTAPTYLESADSAWGAPTAPTYAGGVGEESAHAGADSLAHEVTL